MLTSVSYTMVVFYGWTIKLSGSMGEWVGKSPSIVSMGGLLGHQVSYKLGQLLFIELRYLVRVHVLKFIHLIWLI